MWLGKRIAWAAGTGLALTMVLVATSCESTRALVATPAATPWPAGSYLKAVLLLARPAPADRPDLGRPNMLIVQASDSSNATDALPPDVASASTLALLAAGAAIPVGAAATVSSGLAFPALACYPPNITPLLPRSDGTQDLHFLVNQRLVRAFTASLSVLP